MSRLRTETSHAELERIDRENVWHAFTQMSEYHPFIVDSAQGIWLQDIHGNRFLDGVSSMWCNVHGHQHPKIDQAISEQLKRVAHVTSLGMSNPTTIELTRMLVDRSPDSLECIFYGSDGSSAVEVALKMAFQYWRQCEPAQPQRDLFLALGGAYHGDSLGSVSVGGVSRFHAMFEPLLFDVVRGPAPDNYRLPAHITGESNSVRDQQATEYYLEAYQRLFQQFGERLAGVIIEPIVQGAAGMIMHPPGFLSGIARMTKEHNSLLILDEIAVGLGRTGSLWACDQESVCPDILCIGKGLSGGYLPISATLTTRNIWNAFLGTYEESKSLFHGHTYGGNPLAAAASIATLQLFDTEKTLDHVRLMGEHLQQGLAPLLDLNIVGDVRTTGLIGAVELVADKSQKIPFEWKARVGHRVCENLLSKGVWLRPLGNVVVIMPPLCIQEADIDLLCQKLRAAIHETQLELNLS